MYYIFKEAFANSGGLVVAWEVVSLVCLQTRNETNCLL